MRRLGCLCIPAVPSPDSTMTQALIEVALAHSPLVEAGGPDLVYLDLTGLEALFGDDHALGRRLARSAAERGLDARVGIAGSRIGALAAARLGGGVTVIAPGGEAGFLAPAPLSLLGLPDELLMRLARWGLGSCGALAVLPSRSLFERLGQEGLRLHRLARGEDARPLRRYTPPPAFTESTTCDWGVETRESLLAMLTELAERLVARLTRRGMQADRLAWCLRLRDRTVMDGQITPAVPVVTLDEVIPLLRSAIQARPPGGPVDTLMLSAHPVRVAPEQGSLTELPRPGARPMAETLARLTALVGHEHIGMPALLDTYRPDAVRLAPFRLAAGLSRPASRGGEGEGATLVLRRLRPPSPAAVTLVGGRPLHLRTASLRGPIVSSAGPWRSSGEWWGSPWAHDEWDAELSDGTLCRLAHSGSAWRLEGVYD